MNNNDTKVRGRGFTFTLEEEIDLIRGYNTYGKGNWACIFKDSRLCFQSYGHRKREHLCPKWRNLKKNLQFKDHFFIKGLWNECRGLPSKENPNRERDRDVDFDDLSPAEWDSELEGARVIRNFSAKSHKNGILFVIMERGFEERIYFANVRKTK